MTNAKQTYSWSCSDKESATVKVWVRIKYNNLKYLMKLVQDVALPIFSPCLIIEYLGKKWAIWSNVIYFYLDAVYAIYVITDIFDTLSM